MKKQLLISILMLLPMVACADAVEIDGIYYKLILKGNAAEVDFNPNEYSGDVIIPEKIEYDGNYYTVNTILNWAFSYDENLNSVIIPNSITSIGEGAFQGCTGLTSITLGNDINSIGVDAFEGCVNLNSVYVPDLESWNKIFFNYDALFYPKLTSNPLLYAEHFYVDNEDVKDLKIPENIPYISRGAFYGYKGLVSVNIPETITDIGGLAFANCCNLKTANLPNNLIIIPEGLFYGCTSLENVEIPNSVQYINGTYGKSCGAFSYCSSLTSLTIPNNVTRIGYSAFSYCTGLTSISLPNSVQEIESGAFYGCSGLTSIETPNSVKNIGGDNYTGGAFQNCGNLKSVIIGSNVAHISELAFANCENIENVYCLAENVPGLAYNAFENSYPEYITLHVPAGCVEAYKDETLYWKQFKTIVEIKDAESITGVKDVYKEIKEIKYIYDLQGFLKRNPSNGIYIVKTQDGKTKKIFVR